MGKKILFGIVIVIKVAILIAFICIFYHETQGKAKQWLYDFTFFVSIIIFSYFWFITAPILLIGTIIESIYLNKVSVKPGIIKFIPLVLIIVNVLPLATGILEESGKSKYYIMIAIQIISICMILIESFLFYKYCGKLKEK